MIGILLRNRLAGLFHSLFYGTKRKSVKIAMAAALLMAAGYLGALMFFWFDAVAGPFSEAGIGFFYFTLFLVLDFCLMLFGCIFTAKAALFEAKDNELLLSLPIRPGHILLSRLLVLIAVNGLLQLVVAVPAAICWLRVSSLPTAGALAFLLICLLLPLTVTAIAALLGWLLSLLTTRIRRKTLVTTLLTLGFLGLYFSFYPKLIEAMLNLAAIGEQLAEKAVAILPLYWLSRAVADGSLTDLLKGLPVLLLPFLLALWILAATYEKNLTTNRGFRKAVYREQAVRAGSAYAALFRRELARLLSSANYLMNCALGVFMSLLAAVFLLLKRETVLSLLPMLPLFGISEDWIPIGLTAALGFFGTMICTTAPSVSLEGKSLWLAQSLPVPTPQVFRAKITLHLVLAVPSTLLLQAVLLFLLRPDWPETVLLLLIPQVFNLLEALLGLTANLLIPNLGWVNETAAVKNSGSCLIAIFGGWLIAAIPAIVFFLLPQLPVLSLLAAQLTLLLLVCLLLTRWLLTRGVRIWQSL